MHRASPIPIPEHQFLLIAAAASWLCPSDRDQFWAAVLPSSPAVSLGEGVVARAVTKAFKAFYRPVEVSEEPQQLRKLTRGERKLEKKFEEIFDGNGVPRCRRRSDVR